MALPDVHINLAVPTPADRMLVYVLWLLASKTHNLIGKVSCYAYLFIISEMVHKVPLPTPLRFLNRHSLEAWRAVSPMD